MKIKQFKPHLLLVGLGSPKQEEFIYENIQTLNVPLSIGIGGMIDIISGTVKRAPKIMRDTGTEWLYRLLSQPKRLKRQLVLPKFYYRLCLSGLKGLINKGTTYMNRIGIIGAMQIEIDLLLEN